MRYQPLVTITIPLYNGSNFIRDSIECAINQTYRNVEIIVVNDGSRDNGQGEAIVLEYKDKVRYYRKENGGVSSALNMAIDNMTGEWLSWLSHDDLYTVDKIEKQIQYINELLQNDPGLDLTKTVVHCNAELINVEGKRLYGSKPPYIGKVDNLQVILKNLRRNSLGGCSFLLPRQAFSDVGKFDEKIRTISDFDYWYRLLFAGYHFHQMEDVLVKYRMHKSQVTYKMAGLAKLEADDFYLSVIERLAQNKEYSSFNSLFTAGCYALERGYSLAAKTAFSYAKPKTNIYTYLINGLFKLPCYLAIGAGRHMLKRAFILVKV